MAGTVPISIAIPTYGRGSVLVDTLAGLLSLDVRAAEILVLDQNPSHDRATGERLQLWSDRQEIRWIRLAQPSITKAMNAALCQARQELVLFLDDDIRPCANLVGSHFAVSCAHPGALVAGRVIQPWDPDEPQARPEFHFNQPQAAWAPEFIGCNFSIPRAQALSIGGFDENFVRVAYRFEAEFADRWVRSGHRIRYEPEAMLHHLKAPSGGTRTWGEHLTALRADHSVGAYYFALRTGRLREFAQRPVRAVATRFHLRRPWRIPPSLVAELVGMLWALKLHARGPKLLKPPPPPQ